MNSRLDEPVYFTLMACAVGLAAVSSCLLSVWLLPVVIALLAYPLYWVYNDDLRRRGYSLTYSFDTEANPRWAALSAALEQAASSQCLWQIDSFWNGRRLKVGLSRSIPSLLRTNLQPFCLAFGRNSIIFLPDRVYALLGGRYVSLEYTCWTRTSQTTSWTEDGPLPSDAVVVGQRWLHAKKDGTRDRRFKDNRATPIVQYLHVRWVWSGRLELDLLASKLTSMEQLHRLSFGSAAGTAAGESRGSTRNQSRTSSERRSSRASSNDRRRQTSVPPSRVRTDRLPKCYTVQGLSPNCSREEASKAYKRLAKQHHPDRVAHRGSHDTYQAEQKMKEINAAYSSLKELHGWR